MDFKDFCISINTSNPELLREAYETVCNTYAQRLCELWAIKWGDRWVGGHVGDVLDVSDVVSWELWGLDMPNIVLIVDNSMGYDEFCEWFGQWRDLDNRHRINLRSWLMGARPEMFNGK